jgi:hypothetical protein
MKLYGWEKVSSADEYREMIEAEYYRLKEERERVGAPASGLEEVKLKLFLSLLERPVHLPTDDQEPRRVTSTEQRPAA